MYFDILFDRYDHCLYSDFFKDVHGFRPRGSLYPEPWEMGEALDALQETATIVWAEDEAREKRAIASFEEMIANLIVSGAGDRATALRWVREGQDEYWRDNDSMSYNFGLPYGYSFEGGAA